MQQRTLGEKTCPLCAEEFPVDIEVVVSDLEAIIDSGVLTEHEATEVNLVLERLSGPQPMMNCMLAEIIIYALGPVMENIPIFFWPQWYVELGIWYEEHCQ